MVIKEGYKQTEIGVIPNDWKIKYLDEISDVIDPHPSHRAPAEVSSGIPFLGIGDFTEDGKLKKENYRVVSKAIFDEHKLRYNLNDELLGLGRVASIGKVVKFRNDLGEYTISPTLGILKPTNTTRDFLFQILKSESVIQYFSKIMSGSTRSSVGMIVLRKIPVPVPTKPEQTAIATALSDADGLITGLEKLIAKKRNIKQGAMQQLLQPKDGWEVKKLGEVATIVRGASPRPIEDTKWFDNQSPIGWVRISDVTKSKKVLTETTQKLSDLGVKNSRLVENGNLIMSICATVGRPILTTFDVCIHDGFVVFRNPQIDKEYLYYFLTFIEDNWSKSGQTGSQMNLNTALINNTEIPFPKSNEEQTRFAKIFSDMDAELSALEQKQEKYKKVKLGMMQELLTGKTRLV